MDTYVLTHGKLRAMTSFESIGRNIGAKEKWKSCKRKRASKRKRKKRKKEIKEAKKEERKKRKEEEEKKEKESEKAEKEEKKEEEEERDKEKKGELQEEKNETLTETQRELSEKDAGEKSKRAAFVRMVRYRKQQQAYSTIARELIDKAKALWKRKNGDAPIPPIRLLWGDAKFSHTGHHRAPCPNISLRVGLSKFFESSRLDMEYGSTIHSACCHTHLEDKNWFHPKTKRAYRCPTCGRPWSRDLGAATNIKFIDDFQSKNAGELPIFAQRKQSTQRKVSVGSSFDQTSSRGPV